MVIKRGYDDKGHWTYDDDAIVYTRYLRAYCVRDDRLYRTVDVFYDPEGTTSRRDGEQ
jgi:hypothetical protein